MSVNYNIPTINSRLAAVITSIDAGSSFGQMRLMANSVTVSVLALQKPSGTVGGGVLTFAGSPTGTILINTSSSNPLATADIEDSTGTVIVSGLTIGLSTAYDIVVPTTTVSAGQSITLTSATITGV
jgi:hypothetical protein